MCSGERGGGGGGGGKGTHQVMRNEDRVKTNGCVCVWEGGGGGLRGEGGKSTHQVNEK